MTKVHRFGCRYLKTCQLWLKLLEIIFCLSCGVLCSYYGIKRASSHFQSYVIKSLVISCGWGAIISLILILLYVIAPIGRRIRGILAGQLYIHLIFFILLAVLSAFFLLEVIKKYTAKDLQSMGMSVTSTPNPLLNFNKASPKSLLNLKDAAKPDTGKEIGNIFKGCGSSLESLTSKKDTKFFKTMCVGSDGLVVKSVSQFPNFILLAGTVFGILAAIVYLVDALDCICRSKAPLRCDYSSRKRSGSTTRGSTSHKDEKEDAKAAKGKDAAGKDAPGASQGPQTSEAAK